MTIFERTHKQTGEVIRGTWDEVCDLDKRLWSEPIDTDSDDYQMDMVLLAALPVKVKPTIDTYDYDTAIFYIYSLSDLNGIYLG